MKAMNLVTPLPLLLLPVALLLGVAIGTLNPLYAFLLAGALILAIAYMLRLDAFIAVLVVGVHILVDSFMGFAVYQTALMMGLALLAVCYLGRSKDRPWTAPTLYWFWIPFLLLTTIAVLEGGKFSLSNSIGYYLLIIAGGFVMFWLGNILSRDISGMRAVFQCFAMMATLFAIHTIIQALTGVFLLQSLGKASTQDAQFLLDTGNARLGGFFVNPNGNGIFLATSCFIPLGLFIESKKPWTKTLHLVQTLLILTALTETYSTGSWVATVVGLVVFIALIGRLKDSVLLILMLMVFAVIGYFVFSEQLAAQLAHSGDTSSSSLHMATWQTALRVMLAYPLFGVGLGNQAYLNLAEPLRVYAQTKPLQEPDNTYLQWGATCGIAVMLLFLAMLSSVFLFALRNWRAAEVRYRVLFGAGIAALVALSVNSLVVDGWTSPTDMPFIGWLIAGLIASPLIRRYLKHRSTTLVEGSVDLTEGDMLARHSKAESIV